ncbi:MAG: SpvB/TcaC N-terminal domain-containing protein [Gammaproteobacteria bacterium]
MLPRHALAAVGAINGGFSVTPTGQAAYVVPLPAPGGAGGLAPRLALVYASGSGPGFLGWNATVGGLSIISRCSSTYTYDNSAAPVNLTSRDKFCLDGQELTLKTGTYGHNGATYDSTPASHMEEVSYTTNNALGPQWFKVLHADGSVWEYGYQFNSEVTATNAASQTVGRVWALDQIKDANGNTVTFHYTQSSGTGAYYLAEVDWGGNANAGTNADHSFVFSYETVGADATVYRYVAGNEITWNQRFTGVSLEYNGTASMTWTPSYLADGQSSNRSRLASMTECAGSDCLPATTLQWQQGTPGYGTAQNTGQAGPADDNHFVADVNGDGREDLIYNRSNVWRVRFGTASGGFGSEYSTSVAVSNAAYAQPIHYQRGAADQILVDSGGHWKILTWTGSSFSTTNTGIATAGDGVAAADINGDGFDDLVIYAKDTGQYSGATLVAYLNTAASGTAGFGTGQTVYALTPPAGNYADTYDGFALVGAQGARGPERALHFTQANAGIVARYHQTETVCLVDGCPPGSRKSYITNYYTQAYAWDNGALAPYGATITHSFRTPPDGSDLVALDANGDGLTDLALDDANGLSLLLNTGSAFTAVAYGASTSGLSLDASIAVDYSGNGRDDLLVPDTTTGDWMRLASTGEALDNPADTGVASGAFAALAPWLPTARAACSTISSA